jgi:hypothetical protein
MLVAIQGPNRPHVLLSPLWQVEEPNEGYTRVQERSVMARKDP